jgi:hypothetical protein
MKIRASFTNPRTMSDEWEAPEGDRTSLPTHLEFMG